MLNYDLSNPRLKAELDWIASLPASEHAERLLVIADVYQLIPWQPALLALFEWAVFEAADTYGIDPTKAKELMTTIQLLELDRGPAAAVTYLLNLDDPENETPQSLGVAETQEDGAWAAIGLADGLESVDH